jgi:hypothetical protein
MPLSVSALVTPKGAKRKTTCVNNSIQRLAAG